jgi:plastocyanin
MAIAANVAWSSSASGTASVSGSGLVTGVATGAPATITATATAGDSTVKNTVLITVVVPVLTSTTINAPSTSVADPGTLQLTATPTDQNGSPMVATVTWGSSAPGIATVGHTTGLVTAVSVGTTTITDTASAGGVTITSSQVITVAVYPTSANVNANANLTFDPTAVDIVAGGTVTWSFFGVTHNVTFSGGAGTPGNIPDQSAGSATRTFTTAGTFGFQCTIHPYMTGTVTVH